jgi:proteasome-associated ATPase
VLNEALNVVIAQGYRDGRRGRHAQGVLADGERALVISHADEERIVRLAEPLLRRDAARGRLAAARAAVRLRLRAHPQGRGRGAHPRRSAGHLLPDIGGLAGQIEQIRDAIELPYLHADLFKEHQLGRPRACCSTARPAAARR